MWSLGFSGVKMQVTAIPRQKMTDTTAKVPATWRCCSRRTRDRGEEIIPSKFKQHYYSTTDLVRKSTRRHSKPAAKNSTEPLSEIIRVAACLKPKISRILKVSTVCVRVCLGVATLYNLPSGNSASFTEKLRRKSSAKTQCYNSVSLRTMPVMEQLQQWNQKGLRKRVFPIQLP